MHAPRSVKSLIFRGGWVRCTHRVVLWEQEVPGSNPGAPTDRNSQPRNVFERRGAAALRQSVYPNLYPITSPRGVSEAP